MDKEVNRRKSGARKGFRVQIPIPALIIMKTPKILSRETKFKGQWLEVIGEKVQLSNGKIVEWETPVSNDVVFIVALDDKNNIYLSEEWRVAWEKDILTVPAGGVNNNVTEEERIQQARNELREEVGFDCKKIEKIGTFLASARTRRKYHLYLAKDLFESPKDKDPDEIIKVVKMPFSKALDLFLSGKRETTNCTMLSLLLARDKLGLK
jgi:8-oxo-dGTP pyrophosphatase MutT (NUDIX family)